MFYDERVEAQSGKIFRKGILIAAILTAVFTVFKALSFEGFLSRDVFSFITEAAIILSAVVILVKGELLRERPEVKDERYYAEKYAYYNKAAKVFLFCAMAGFAGSVLIELSHPSPLSAAYLLVFLELLGFVYVSYEFKANCINLNYSVIDRSNKEYYASVFKGIGKMAGLLAAIYFLPLLYTLAAGDWPSAFSVAIACVESILSIGAIYLIISWIEKVSRNEEDQGGTVYKCLAISFAFVLGLSLFQAVFQIIYIAKATGDLQHTQPLGQLAAINAYMNKYFDYYFNAFLGLSLATSVSYVSGKPRKLIKYLVRYVYAHITFEFIRTVVLTYISVLDSRLGFHTDLIIQFARVSGVIQYALIAVYSVLLILLFCALVKSYGYGKWIVIVQIIVAALQFICYAFRVNNSAANYAALVLGGIVQAALLAGVMISLKGRQKGKSI